MMHTVGHDFLCISRTIVILKNLTVISNKNFDNVFFCIICSAYDQLKFWQAYRGLAFGLLPFLRRTFSKAINSVADPGCLSRIRIFPSRIQGLKNSGSSSENLIIFTLKTVSRLPIKLAVLFNCSSPNRIFFHPGSATCVNGESHFLRWLPCYCFPTGTVPVVAGRWCC